MRALRSRHALWSVCLTIESPRSAPVVLVDNPALMMAHAVRRVRWFLSGMLHNRAALARGEPPWPSGRPMRHYPKRSLTEFVRCMRQPITTWSNQRSLAARACLAAGSGRGHRASRPISVGMHAFVFRDANLVANFA